MTGLSAHERDVYAWQMTVPGMGEEGQQALRDASVLITRCGGLGSVVAYELAAAGVGRLVLAHAGDIKPSDLNRQLLMTHDALGTSRVESARRRLLELNPRLEIEAIPENASDANARGWAESVDVVVDAAPLFTERHALNRACVATRTPLIECAMYELQGHVTTVRPGVTPCLRCLFEDDPPAWRRQFPVFGAISGTAGCMAAMEAIKVITGVGTPLEGRMVLYDLRDVDVRVVTLQRDASCPVCASLWGDAEDHSAGRST